MIINEIFVSYTALGEDITYQMRSNLNINPSHTIAELTSNIMENTMLNPREVIELLINRFCPDYILTEKEDKE